MAARDTKRMFADELEAMMARMPLSKVRVADLCARCSVERRVFYYHFKDKYDLVAWIFFHDAYETDVISVESAAEGLKKMKQDILFYKRAYEDNSQNPLWAYMHAYFVERYTKLAKEMLGTEVLDPQIGFSIRHYCFGSVAMTQEWVLQDNITPAETVVEMMFRSMPENLREIFFDE